METLKFRLFCILVLFFSLYLYSNDITDVIRIGYHPQNGLITDINSYDRKGYGYDILKKIEETSDLRFEFISIEGSTLEALDNGEVDVIGLYYQRESFAQKYIFLDTPFNVEQTSLVAKGDVMIPYDHPESIDGKTVATYYTNPANEELDAYLAENNISVNYIMGDYYNYKDVEADYYMLYSSYIGDGNFTTVLNFSKRHTYLMSRIGNEDLMEKINTILEDIIIEESGFFTELEDKYYEDTSHYFHRNLRYDELQLLRARPIKVAYDVNHEPVTFKDEAGEPEGAIVGVMEELAAVYGFDVEYYPYSYADPTSLPADCDIVISSLGDYALIAEDFRPTESFYEMMLVAIVSKEKVGENPSIDKVLLESPRIGVLEYFYINYDSLLENIHSNEIVFYDNFRSLLEAYKNNDIDMAIFSENGTNFASSYLGENKNQVFATDIELQFHFSIANDVAEDYVPIFNVMLDNLSEERYEEILINKTGAFAFQPPITRVIIQHWYYIVIFIFIIILFFRTLRIQHQKALLSAYNTDALTGLMTVDRFRNTVIELLNHAKNTEYELISLDVDMFKTINLYYSAQKGTEVIRTIGNTLSELFDNSTSHVSRKTADQFYIFRKVDKNLTLEKICYEKLLPNITSILGDRFHFTMSFGNVIVENSKEKVSAIIGYADAARVQGKTIHENTFITFDTKMRKDFENKISVTLRMEEALFAHEFVVVYQPKIDFKTLRVGGAEALIRWRPKEGDQIYPDTFIPVFEENGFIFHLDMYVFEEVCKFVVTNNMRIDIPRISVNLSALSVLHDEIIPCIQDINLKYGLTPEEIEFEVTESAIIGNEEKFISKVHEIKSLGFLISIDDFGAGVSSLNRLAAIEADILKLDKAFFDVEDSEEKVNVVVSDVIRMAKELKMLVVAEGVETIEQAKWLKSIDCDYAQGYYFEKPMEKQAFINLLVSKRMYSLETSAPNNATGLFESGLRNY